MTCTVDGFAGPVRAGLHAATGGDGTDACSGDLLLEALLACAGVTLRSVATAMAAERRIERHRIGSDMWRALDEGSLECRSGR